MRGGAACAAPLRVSGRSNQWYGRLGPPEQPMKAAFTPGTTFANYRVESLIGRGGMGLVYRATDLSLERPVALKLIAPELAEDKRFTSRFLREPRLAASLDHPNVIPIYEAGEHEGQLYPVAGAPRIAVGAGAVWAANPDGSVSRIDAKTARIVATRNGRLGMDDRRRRRGRLVPRQRRPDHRRHPDRPEEEPVTQRVPVGANSLAGVAVGAGSV